MPAPTQPGAHLERCVADRAELGYRVGMKSETRECFTGKYSMQVGGERG
jgi:hypothetical protein